jgi:hypothetical protein
MKLRLNNTDRRRDRGQNTTKRNKRKEIVVRAHRFIIEHIHRHAYKEPIKSKVKRFLRLAPLLMYDVVCGTVLRFFKSVNRKGGRKISLWAMKLETFQHLHLLTRILEWIVLPASVVYICLDLYLFGQNALDSMFLGLLIFVYSSFIPDLPSIYRRRRIYGDTRAMTEDLSWYKKYALLLFAPLFIGAFFLGIRLKWKTTETFHNFKSLIVYGAFLLTIGFFAFGDLSMSIGEMTEVISLPIYGLAGYLTHLKVDLIF